MMKLKELLKIIDETEIIFINSKKYSNNLSEEILNKEITKINIETKNKPGEDLESLGYSFEAGV